MSDRAHHRFEIARIEAALDALLDRITARPCDDAAGRALRLDVQRLGEWLFDLGGTALMQSTIYRVADLDRRCAGRRIDLMDKWWSGIGDDADRWVA